MEQRETPESSCNMKMDQLDRLSNLPCHILDMILGLLHLKEVTRMSVLSTKWRYKSATLQDLVFDEECVSAGYQTTFVNIVDHVLLLHVGPINKFKLSNQNWRTTTDVDRWILYLTRNSVKEFLFENWTVPRFTMPSCFFSHQEITELSLRNCLLKPPSTFKGFRSLKSLRIEKGTLAQDVFENLIVRTLQSLALIDFDGLTDLNIDAPNLAFVYIHGSFEDVNFVNTPNLVSVTIALDNHVVNHQRRRPRNSGNLVKFFAQLPHVRWLQIQYQFSKYLADGIVSGELPKPCLDLTSLHININFNVWDEVLASVFMLRSSPSLQELDIWVHFDARETKSSQDSQVYDNCIGPFAQLRRVSILDISGTKPELDFIRFLLSNSPMLEKMTVRRWKHECGFGLVIQLLKMKRASANAEIIYLGFGC